MSQLIKNKMFIYGLVAGAVLISIFVAVIAILEINKQPEASRYLDKEEVVIIKSSIPDKPIRQVTTSVATVDEPIEQKAILPIQPALFKYVEVVDGCGPNFEDDCLNVRSGPGLEYNVVRRLRNGVILKVGGLVNREDQTWYKIIFDE